MRLSRSRNWKQADSALHMQDFRGSNPKGFVDAVSGLSLCAFKGEVPHLCTVQLPNSGANESGHRNVLCLDLLAVLEFWFKFPVIRQTLCSTVLETLIVTQLVRKLPAFCITVFTTARDWPLSHTFPPYFPNIHFDMFLPSTPKPPDCFLPFGLSDENLAPISHFISPMHATCPRHV